MYNHPIRSAALSLLCASALFYLSACGTNRESRRTGKDVLEEFKNIFLVAWNEDTVNSYRVALLRDGVFYYNTEKPDGRERKKITGYRGRYVLSSNDTIRLYFEKEPRWPMCDYFIRSGQYLSQYFADGRGRMFLRIQPGLFSGR